MPVIVHVTVETTGTMLLGSEIGAALTALEPLGIDYIGLNCATGPTEMSEHLRYLSRHATHRGVGDAERRPAAARTERRRLPADPARSWPQALSGFVTEFGLGLVGGCCGTTPEHLRQVVEAVREAMPAARRPRPDPGLSSLYQAVPFQQDASVLMVGERTNANGSKAFREAMLAENWQHCVDIARAQTRDGAHLLDLNVDYVGRDGAADMSAHGLPAGHRIDPADHDRLDRARR